MAIMDMFRVTKIKSQLDATEKERDALRTTLSSTEHMTHFELTKAIAELAEKRDTALCGMAELEAGLEKKRQSLNQQLVDINRQAEAKRAELNKEFDEKRKELVMMDEEVLLQSFGFYKPKYNLTSSEAYKVRLDQIRKQQEELVKSGRAATASTSWTINNSQAEGARMVKDYVKLILRSFNNECDASIVGVKFNNVESTEKRIRKAFDALNTLGKRMTISIIPTYLDLKIQELHLCYEYQVKKQQEKEEQKLLREQLREEAKVQKEIEEMRAKVAKEERHFAQALQTLDARLVRVDNETERQLLEQERTSLLLQLTEVEKTKQDILNREQNTRAGYVYVISNVGSFGENVYKIGVTRRLEPQERIDELGDASVPFNFDIHTLIFSDDAPALENALHKAFEKRRLNMINRRREFFHVTLDEIKQVVTTHFKKPVEFVELADAQQFRQSLILNQAEASTPVIPSRFSQFGVSQ